MKTLLAILITVVGMAAILAGVLGVMWVAVVHPLWFFGAFAALVLGGLVPTVRGLL